MKRLILGFLVGGFLDVAGGFAGGLFVYPYWFLRDVAAEMVSNAETKSRIATGMFIHADANDPVHWDKGRTTIYGDRNGERLIHLESDFEVGPGPRFHVYLVEAAEVTSNAVFRASASVDLGRLKAFKGSQNYQIPANVDLARYKSIVVWCKEFGVLITPATLMRG